MEIVKEALHILKWGGIWAIVAVSIFGFIMLISEAEKEAKSERAKTFGECIDRVKPSRENTLWCYEAILVQK